MKTKLFLMIILSFLSTSASSEENCGNLTNRAILTCTQRNLVIANKRLNAEYSMMKKNLSGPDLNNLQSAERIWVAYKNKYCQDAFDATSPGNEAGIDKWQCLYSVTSRREMELKYINSQHSNEEFFRSIELIAEIYENGDINRVINKINNESNWKIDDLWNKYVQTNCKLTHSKLSEENNICVARMNFYRDWR